MGAKKGFFSWGEFGPEVCPAVFGGNIWSGRKNTPLQKKGGGVLKECSGSPKKYFERGKRRGSLFVIF